MVKIALAGIVAVLCALLLKNEKAEYAVFISMAGCLLIFLFGISKLEVILAAINRFQGYLGAGSEYLPVLLRIVGITYLTEFSADLCRDAGFSAVAGQVELAGKLTIMAVSLPILLALLEVLEEFLP